MSDITKNTFLILPGDSDVEVLRKNLLKTVKDPRQKRFEQLRDEGLDSETAADLAGLRDWTPQARAGAMLQYAQEHSHSSADIEYTAVRETNQALRAVGAAAGATVAGNAGMHIFRFIARHSAILTVASITGGGVVLAVITAKVVSHTLGAKLATVAAANILSASGILAAATFMTKR